MVIDYIPIKDLQIGQTYTQVFYIAHVEAKRGNKGIYGALTLSDISGEINGYIWDYTPKLPLKRGSWVKLKVHIKEYKNERNFITWPADLSEVTETPLNKSDYFYSIHENVLKVHKERITEFIAQIEDPDYRDIIGNSTVSERLDLLNLIKDYPYGLKNNLACDGGLLVHTNGLISLALSMLSGLKHFELPINKSLVITGAIFRNLGWTSTLYKDLLWTPRNSYYLTGVRQASFMIANHICMTTESDLKTEIPEPKKNALFEACLKNNINEVYTPENKILITANQLLDTMIDAEGKLMKAKIGQDMWLNSLFIGHHANRPEK